MFFKVSLENQVLTVYVHVRKISITYYLKKKRYMWYVHRGEIIFPCSYNFYESFSEKIGFCNRFVSTNSCIIIVFYRVHLDGG